jgi:uncharacterized protein (DUF433 family)
MSRSARRPKATEEARSGVKRRRGEPKVLTTLRLRLGVWEVLRDFCRDNDLESLRQTFSDLSQAQLTGALMYYRRYPEEIQRQVEANARLTPEVIEKEFPGLVRFISVG